MEERNYYYRFPEGLIENGKKVILYGAGDIGKNYYQYMQEKNIWDLVAWVDAAAEKYKNLCNNVQSVDIITKLEFDVILIAVMEEKTAQSIHRSLCARGIPDDKILWMAPAF